MSAKHKKHDPDVLPSLRESPRHAGLDVTSGQLRSRHHLLEQYGGKASLRIGRATQYTWR
jgi:hypothetical protein